jgi:hypothetical protein
MSRFDEDAAKVGGGTITFRVALFAVAGFTLWMLETFGSHIVGQLDTIAKVQNSMASTLATQVQLNSDTAALAQRNTIRLDDHEHRLTILESRAKP